MAKHTSFAWVEGVDDVTVSVIMGALVRTLEANASNRGYMENAGGRAQDVLQALTQEVNSRPQRGRKLGQIVVPNSWADTQAFALTGVKASHSWRTQRAWDGCQEAVGNIVRRYPFATDRIVLGQSHHRQSLLKAAVSRYQEEVKDLMAEEAGRDMYRDMQRLTHMREETKRLTPKPAQLRIRCATRGCRQDVRHTGDCG